MTKGPNEDNTNEQKRDQANFNISEIKKERNKAENGRKTSKFKRETSKAEDDQIPKKGSYYTCSWESWPLKYAKA
jgi:hypothetical protein